MTHRRRIAGRARPGRRRRHDPAVQTLAVVALLGAGAVTDSGTLLLLEHVLMLAGMFGVMLLRPEEYSHVHHDRAPVAA